MRIDQSRRYLSVYVTKHGSYFFSPITADLGGRGDICGAFSRVTLDVSLSAVLLFFDIFYSFLCQ